jgi:hypothetical protein
MKASFEITSLGRAAFCHFFDFDPIQSPQRRDLTAPLPHIVQTQRMQSAGAHRSKL